MGIRPASPEPRAICTTCWRPESVCYCAHVTRIPTKTRVVVLQHPRERDMPINTARIAALCLENAELHVGATFDEAKLARALEDPNDPSRRAVLLYPGPEAIDIAQDPPKEPVTLVVLDGTWWQAKKLFTSNPLLASLPRYSFTPEQPSDYRIRSEPRDDYVSTLEALVLVLGILENDPARAQTMLTPFRAMVDKQLAHVDSGLGERRMRVRGRKQVSPKDRLPRLFRERYRDLVCVHGEANAWPYGTPERAQGEELVQWSAERLATGERFDCVLRPRFLAPGTSYHLELSPEVLAAGVEPQEFVRAWADFVRPSDVLCAWGTQAPMLLGRAGAPEPAHAAAVDLRHCARLYARGRVGAMLAFAESIGISPASLGDVRGRAGRRLAELVAIARALSPAPSPGDASGDTNEVEADDHHGQQEEEAEKEGRVEAARG